MQVLSKQIQNREMRGIDGRYPELPEQFRHGLTRRPPSTNCSLSSITELFFHSPHPRLVMKAANFNLSRCVMQNCLTAGVHPNTTPWKSVTYVSGTICYVFDGTLTQAAY